MTPTTISLSLLIVTLLALGPLGCASGSDAAAPDGAAASNAPDDTPPPEIQAWMDRLTVAHAYAPETGFIVAKETIALPPVLTDAPPLDEAVRRAGAERVVIVFATADRCAPCQQFKKDALNDPRVVDRLDDGGFVATHVEVDREPGLAKTYLGGAAIPMSYALRNGSVTATLRGQRSAAELLTWLDDVVGSG